ncbi:tRNA (adenine-N1)-methyltransferase [Gleimia hominis]|uniref:tRNA (Adenine-N1)-methyltransferase n=1 Tax=Gleimia hominis TaxID=595468 RepID=A0ABU3ICC5_9ACTO|nr:tRNA (adenine-N1)-methyltransferase [Gleimia hominis]MDT3767586.1 tRNA (adenine-N1)-methyltransferase [Gleimia hominis]
MESDLTYDVPAQAEHPMGPAGRRGTLKAGEHVQITDPKGRLHTVVLTPKQVFRCSRGELAHNDIIGQPPATVMGDGAHRFLVLRPLLDDYTMYMPRGAAIVYPKDAAQVVQFADIFPGAKVLEAGVGSGALSMSLLNAVGTTGSVHSIEKRSDFAVIAQGNVDLWFGGRHPAWTVTIGDFEQVALSEPAGSIDRIVLDMLTPWECLDATEHALAVGGVLCVYVTTVTQLSRLVEDLNRYGSFTPPKVWENLSRGWHVDGLSVRPEHRMVGHTGFLLTTRKLATGKLNPPNPKRPSPAMEGRAGQWNDAQNWEEYPQIQEERAPKRVRRQARELSRRSRRVLPHEEGE